MKKIKITISGYGGEYTVGSLTKEQAFYWSEKDEDELYEHITDPNPDLIEEDYYIGYWHEIDNVLHSYGASENNLRIYIYFGDEPVREFEDLSDFENTFEMEEVYFENLEEAPYLVCYAGEKGSFWEGEIEIPDDEVFDINNITILTKDLFGENFVVGAQYKDEDMEDIGAGTTGKSFDYRITYPSDELDN